MAPVFGWALFTYTLRRKTLDKWLSLSYNKIKN